MLVSKLLFIIWIQALQHTSLLKARTEECHLMRDVKVFLGNLCCFFNLKLVRRGRKKRKEKKKKKGGGGGEKMKMMHDMQNVKTENDA